MKKLSARRILCAATVIFACLTAHAKAGSVQAEIQSMRQITDTGDFPAFSELYYTALKQAGGAGNDDFLVVDGFQMLDRSTGSTASDMLYFCNYSVPGKYGNGKNEAGILSFGLAGGSNPEVDESSIRGFVRRPKGWESYTSNAVGSIFGGAAGTISWSLSAQDREAEIEMSQTIEGVPKMFAGDVELTVGQDSVTTGLFSFKVDGTTDLKYWQFSSATVNKMTETDYSGIIQRTDGLTKDDIAGSGITADPDAFWNKTYIFVLRDVNDADRDGVTDIIDNTFTFSAFPWYADAGGSLNWYYADWMQTWVYSDRTTEWDYSLTLGWIYVPLAGSRDNFWMYGAAPGLGWLWTSEGCYPYIYRASDGCFLYMFPVSNHTATFYNFCTKTYESVQF